jgi:hypothetical protein
MTGGAKRQLVLSLCLLVTVTSLNDFIDDAISSYRAKPGDTVFECPECGRVWRFPRTLICRTRKAHTEDVVMRKWRGTGTPPPNSRDIDVGLA